MLSIGKLAAGPDAGRYYENAIASGREDYYADEAEQSGRWTGSGAASLGLTGEVKSGDTSALLRGKVPGAGRTLGRPMEASSVAGFDLTFKAPKSVSVLFGLGDRELVADLTASHASAIGEALSYLEDEASSVRRGAGGQHKLKARGLTAAAFQHRASRAGDPLLHTHVVVANRAEGPDSRWTALDGKQLYSHAKTAGFVYQAALRRELTDRLGIGWTEVVKGTAEVEGVPADVILHFSKRRQEIERVLEARGEH